MNVAPNHRGAGYFEFILVVSIHKRFFKTTCNYSHLLFTFILNIIQNRFLFILIGIIIPYDKAKKFLILNVGEHLSKERDRSDLSGVRKSLLEVENQSHTASGLRNYQMVCIIIFYHNVF